VRTNRFAAMLGGYTLAAAATACGGAGDSTSSQGETGATTATTTTTIAATVDPIRSAFDSTSAASVGAASLAAAHLAAARGAQDGVHPVPPAVDGFTRTSAGTYQLPKNTHPRSPVTVTMGSAPTLTYDAGLTAAVTISHGGLDGQPSDVTEEPDGAIGVRTSDSSRVVFFVPSEDGVEDFTYVPTHPDAETLDLQLSVPAGAGLRLVDGELAVLDATGTPHIRLAPPRIYFGDGDSALGEVSLPDCAHDTSPAAPWGREITPPTADGAATTCTVDIRWSDSGVTYPALVDPSWTSAGNMATARWSHSATLLSSGRVLVAGGITGGVALASAELYDPTSTTWAATGALHVARASQTATTLGSGATVLVAGGDDNTQALSSCEVYSTSTGTWTTTGSMSGTRDYHNAWSLDSTHVLVAAGVSWTASTWNVLGTSAIYTSTSGTWAATGSLSQPRVFASSISLSSGSTPLIVGGDNGTTVLGTSETYSTLTSTWGQTLGALTAPRENAVISTTSTGATIFGGTNYSGAPLASTETLAILGLAWTSNTSMTTARGLAAIASTSTGPLVIGGGSTSAASLATTEQYNGSLSSVTVGPVLTQARWGHTATTLGNGHVLVAGGLDPTTNLSLTSAELL
jgi:hypothetical protein